MKTFLHSGKMGDLLFGLATIKAMGSGIIYLPNKGPEVTNMYNDMSSFLKTQPYIKGVIKYPDVTTYEEMPVKVDVNLNTHRLQPSKGIIHIVKRHMDAVGIQCKAWKEPWLYLPEAAKAEPYTLFNYTGRHVYNSQWKIGSVVDWATVYKNVTGLKYFVGLKHEHEQFCKMVGGYPEWLETKTVYEVARLVRGADVVYCNQSMVLALAQGFSVKRYVDFKPGKENCKLPGALNEFSL